MAEPQQAYLGKSNMPKKKIKINLAKSNEKSAAVSLAHSLYRCGSEKRHQIKNKE